MYERRVRCLKLIAIAQLFFDHITQPGLTAGLKCPVLKAAMEVDWNKLEGQQWLQSLHFPTKEEVCVVMRFYPSNGTMTLQTRPEPTGTLSGPSFYKLRPKGDRRYIYAHDEKFYQILDTDYASWALIHHCWEGGSGSWFIVALTAPMSEVPAKIMERIQDALMKSGRTRKFSWNRSGCMLKKLEIGAEFVPSSSAPADKLSLVDGAAPEKEEPVDKLSLVDG